ALARRDAVLPLRAHHSAQQVDRTRLDGQRGTFPARAAPSPKSEAARRAERYADHVFEDGPVPVPADPGARRVFRHQNMLQLLGRDSGKGGGGLAQRQQEVGYFVDGMHSVCAEIVMKAERDDPSFTEITVEFKLLESQRPEPVHQLRLLIRGQKFRAILEAIGKRRGEVPKRELNRHWADRPILESGVKSGAATGAQLTGEA